MIEYILCFSESQKSSFWYVVLQSRLYYSFATCIIIIVTCSTVHVLRPPEWSARSMQVNKLCTLVLNQNPY